MAALLEAVDEMIARLAPGARMAEEGEQEGEDEEDEDDPLAGPMNAIAQSVEQASREECDEAIAHIAAALSNPGLDEGSAATLLGVCAAPISAGGDPAPIREYLVIFLDLVLPLSCVYSLLVLTSPVDVVASLVQRSSGLALPFPAQQEAREEMPSMALGLLSERLPSAGAEPVLLSWVWPTVHVALPRDPQLAEAFRHSRSILPALFALAVADPNALHVLQVVDPRLTESIVTAAGVLNAQQSQQSQQAPSPAIHTPRRERRGHRH